MDVVTHTVVAAAIGTAGYRVWGRRGLVWLLVAANLPELERVVELASPAVGVKTIHGVGHSLLMAPVLGLPLAAWLARRLQSWKSAAQIVALGLGSHLALDLVSGPGVRLLWPVYPQLFGCRLVTRYDLWTLLVLGVTLVGTQLLNLVNRDMGAAAYRLEPPASAGLVIVAALLGVRAVTMMALESRWGPLSPSALSPLTWYAVTDGAEDYTVEEITPWGEGPTFRFRKPQPNRVFETAAETPLAQAFLETAQFPLYSLERGDRGMLVRIRDLRFYTPVGEGKEYSVEIEVTPQLQVVGQRARM